MLVINSNWELIVYSFDCRNADAVRLDFTWNPYDSEGHIRIHEIEVMGR